MAAAVGSGVLVRPKRSLLRNAIWSVLLFSAPLYGAVYILGIPNGTWPGILASQVGVVTLCLLVWLRYRAVAVRVTEVTLEEQGFFCRTSRALSDVRSVTLVHTYRSSSAETWTQLLVTDEKDGRLLRMRGTFWREAEMRLVAEATGVPLTLLPEPMTRRVFIASHPCSADWYESSRTLAAVSLAVILVAAVGVVMGLMSLAGVPIALGI